MASNKERIGGEGGKDHDRKTGGASTDDDIAKLTRFGVDIDRESPRAFDPNLLKRLIDVVGVRKMISLNAARPLGLSS